MYITTESQLPNMISAEIKGSCYQFLTLSIKFVKSYKRDEIHKFCIFVSDEHTCFIQPS